MGSNLVRAIADGIGGATPEMVAGDVFKYAKRAMVKFSAAGCASHKKKARTLRRASSTTLCISFGALLPTTLAGTIQ